MLVPILLGAACGGDEPAALITVDLGDWTVPGEVDALHFELSDGAGVFYERTFMLDADETRPTLTILPGPRKGSANLGLIVRGFLGPVPVGQSVSVGLRFRDDRITRVVVSLLPML